jgi:hypothetical protein
MFRPIRIAVIFSLVSLSIWSGTLVARKTDASIYLDPTPLQLAEDLSVREQWEDILLLTRFSMNHMPEQDPAHRTALQTQARENLESPAFLARRFTQGALTGEPVDTASLLGSLSLDVLVIGDIRDLFVQGYREVDTGDGDVVIMALSATGLLLTLAPEISWAPGLFKGFYRGGKISRPMMKQVERSAKQAVKTGDVVPLRRLLSDFSDVVRGLGAGPSLAVMKQVKSADELGLLARKAMLAPAETYTLVRLSGVGSLRTVKGEGKLVKGIKLGARQQKIVGKVFLAMPLTILVLMFGLSTGLALYLFVMGLAGNRSAR